jgi:biotin carboxyl carrier protein
MKLNFQLGAKIVSIDLSPGTSISSFEATLDSGMVPVHVLRTQSGSLVLVVDSKQVMAYVSSDGPKRWITVNGQTHLLTKSSGRPRGGHGGHSAGELTAPMPGQVRAVNVEAGDSVTKGQTLLLLEAMKMEIRVQSPQEGRVRAVHVRQGQTVEREQVLIEVE